MSSGASAVLRIGKYDITGEIGRGGMGVVYRGEDKRIKRQVAIKRLLTRGLEDSERETMLQRFYNEAQNTANLNHPNIVTVYDFGETDDGDPYIVMEFLEGRPLDKLISTKPPVPVFEKLGIISQVCMALNYAHKRGVVHRDIKPANVMVLADGTVKLVDFGIAKQEKSDLLTRAALTRMNTVIGSLYYIAPERFQGQEADGRSDIFSTGVMLYQFLTDGVLPWDAGDDTATVYAMVNSPRPPLSKYLSEYPPELDLALDKALAKLPENRYSTAEEFGFELESISNSQKGQYARELYGQAQTLAARAEYNRARDVLLQLTNRVDTHHTGAKKLLIEVQQGLQQQQRVEQVRQLRFQAEEALAQDHYQDAINALQNAVKLDPTDPAITTLLSTALESKEKKEEVEKLLREAEEARDTGNYEVAHKLASRAVQIAPTDLHAKAVYLSVRKEAEEQAKQKEVRGLIDSARQEITARKFTAALDILRKIEVLDPNVVELPALLDRARAGQEQEHRRKEMDRVSSEVDAALAREDFMGALSIADEALKKFPGDASLLRIRALADEQFQSTQQRKFIEEQVQVVRDLLQKSNREAALQVIDAALKKVPRDSRLLALRTDIQRTIETERAEGATHQRLKEAREAIERKDFRKAVDLLEDLTSLGGSVSSEITGLLDFAKAEWNKQQRAATIEGALVAAEHLIAQESYEKAIAALEAAIRQYPDQALQLLLAQARDRHEQATRKFEVVVRQAQELFDAGKHEQTISLLSSQPPALQNLAKFQELATRVRTVVEREKAIQSAVQKARAALKAGEIVQCEEILQATSQAYGDSATLKQARADLDAQRDTIARTNVQNAIDQARTSLVDQKYQHAIELLNGVEQLVVHVSPEMQAEWHRLGSEAAAILAKRSGTRRISGTFGTGPAVAAPPQSNGAVIGIAVFAVVAILGVLGYTLLFRAAPPPPSMFVQLNAAPWGTVKQVIPEKGKPIDVNEATPVRISAPMGKMTIVMVDPDGGEHRDAFTASPENNAYTASFSDPPIDDIVKNSR